MIEMMKAISAAPPSNPADWRASCRSAAIISATPAAYIGA